MFASLLGILGSALSIWDNKEKRKYIDKMLQLKKDYYEEFNKPLAVRSDAVLDNLEFELRNLADAVAADIGKQNAPN